MATSTAPDGQQTLHGSLYAYSDPHWAEFYDLWIDTIFDTSSKPHEDVAFLWDALKSVLLDKRDVSSGIKTVIRVIDVGTGTGRVVKSLVKCAMAEHVSLDGVIVLAIDHGAAMVERARRTFPTFLEGEEKNNNRQLGRTSLCGFDVTWRECSASEMTTRNPSFKGNTDLIIFSAGGLGHLTADGEIGHFLGQVKDALNEDGVAIISILHETIASRGGGDAPMKTVEGPGLHDSMIIASLERPGVRYRKSGTWQRWDDRGIVRTDGFTIEMLEEKGGIEEVAKKEVEWSLRVFEEETWEDGLKSVGLKIDNVVEGEIQRFYYVKRG